MLLSASPGFTHFLGNVTYRLGLGNLHLRQIYQRAALLRLPFAPLLLPDSGIGWKDSGALSRLVGLARGALSGPVQEDKVAAWRVLRALVKKTEEAREALDLREIDGLNLSLPEPAAHLEELVAKHGCNPFRILSYQDFVRTLSLALPDFQAGAPIHLLSAGWLGQRLFWAGEQQREALACAVVYVRLRGLQVTLPAQIERYALCADGLEALRRHYHALLMPKAAWTCAGFMQLLLESQVPYARFSRLHEGEQEVLLLPRSKARSHALGLGLRAAGAFDLADCLAERARQTA